MVSVPPEAKVQVEESTVRQALVEYFEQRGVSQGEIDEAVDAWKLGYFIYEENPYGPNFKLSGALRLGRRGPKDGEPPQLPAADAGASVLADADEAHDLPTPFQTLDEYIAVNEQFEKENRSVPVDGFAWDRNERKRVDFFEIQGTTKFERIMDCLFWYFRGKPNRIIKAFSIPYKFRDQPEGSENFLLVGYHGQGC